MIAKKAIYLKANRMEAWAIDNLHRWMKTSYMLGYDTFIVCDNDTLTAYIKKMEFADEVTVIKSIKKQKERTIIEKITIPQWNNAGYAHLTTFVHAICNKYDWFWNVDADDTFFCLPVDRTVQLLKEVEEYAEEKRIDVFSLDMWFSRLNGEDWSFGVTYTNGCVDWEKLILESMKNYTIEYGSRVNIDNFFFYLRSNKKACIESWYCENLIFVHYNVDFIKHFIYGGVYHFKNGTIFYPVANIFPSLNVQEVLINEEVARLDIDIDEKEISKTILYYSDDGHVRSKHGLITWEDIEGSKIISRRQTEFNIRKFSRENPMYVLYGIGKCFKDYFNVISKVNDISLVADGNAENWGWKYNDKVVCINPKDIRNLDNVVVIITIYNIDIANEIIDKLNSWGIKAAHIKEWERAVFCDNKFI